jgi:energy-coupling factor transport system ATP-binding protein
MISVRNLSFRYEGREHKTLDNINLDINLGELIVLTGESGCGKTTFALALTGFLSHLFVGEYSGTISINDENIENKPLTEIAEDIYLVQQNPQNQFVTLTVRDEIAFGLENKEIESREIHVRIKKALQAVCAEELFDRNIDTLSGGEKQKIAIATAIALQPKIVILDEPTSNLDIKSTKNVYRVFKRLIEKKEITLIIIEHKLSELMHFSPRILKLMSGKIIPQKDKKQFTNLLGKTHERARKDFRRELDQEVIQLEDYSVHRNGNEVLKISSLEINKGELISILGNNGAGKSSFILGLMGILHSTGKKRIIFNNQISDIKRRKHPEKFGIVFQNPDHQFFCETVEDEIIFPFRNYFPSDALDPKNFDVASTFADLSGELKTHPIKLSYGQKKRLSIAAVLAYHPELLLLDEIFIGQSNSDIIRILSTLDDYRKKNNATVLIINHQLGIVHQYADRAIFFDEGRILFDAKINKVEENLMFFKKSEYLEQLHAI